MKSHIHMAERGHNMYWIAKQDYMKVQREIVGTEQKQILDHRVMYLYSDRIVTRYREFALKDVYDISYRRMGGDKGFLYLHTNRGLYSYLVSVDPSEFIASYKQLL